MESAEEYRRHAEDCRRLAEKAAAKDRAALLEIAAAGDQCAIEAKRKDGTMKSDKKRDGFDVRGNDF
jgi:hypothetical protein